MTRNHLVLALPAILALAGCVKPGGGGIALPQPAGGGSTSVQGRQVAYGIGEDGVAFALFTDIPSDSVASGSKSASGLSGSRVEGYVAAGSGQRVDYASDFESITIAGKEHPLAQGRVFLVSAPKPGQAAAVRQVNVPIQPTPRDQQALKAEIARLAETKEVAEFLPTPAGKGE
jgi:hypothetical protein